MQYLAGLALIAVAGAFAYLIATVPNNDIALGYGVGILIALLLFVTSAWLGYTLRSK